MKAENIRNFCIIAHIDHGKSTLADRFLQITGTLEDRDMVEQVLDSMDLEREKGVTIKASAVRMNYTTDAGESYILNLIDTPGHVDFGYEVSRALAACEGAVLVVDATQGIEAQTLANLYLAMESDLVIIPVINKIDLGSSEADAVAEELEKLLGVAAEDILRISAKQGTNVETVLQAIVERVPPPQGNIEKPLRALIFDSHYDPYKGVIAYVRILEGKLSAHEDMLLMASGTSIRPLETGIFSPGMVPFTGLQAGEVGYVATGLKTVRECRVGDTFTLVNDPAAAPLPGYRSPKPMVFAGFFPVEGEEYADLKEALEKLQLNDAALVFEPETSQALNYGFRCGFLGMFHMEIIQERLEREHNIQLIATAPSVAYRIVLIDGESKIIASPAELPDRGEILEIHEPWVKIQVFTPDEYVGTVMDLIIKRRGNFESQEYPAPNRVILHAELPLAEMIIDFFDLLKSRTRGYASLDYQFIGNRPEDLVKLDVLINHEPVDALALIVHRSQSFSKGKALVAKLKELIPRQLFAVPVQASVDGRIIARENISAMRKDVIAKCYGGDITRKRKLLEQQKRGKKRLKRVGQVDIPQDAFLALLRINQE
ncbi:MAG: elongation factor 4 [Anaerolineales bacterium]|nr:MAG: elongation factor 4 [Anaerolineales bacterium]